MRVPILMTLFLIQLGFAQAQTSLYQLSVNRLDGQVQSMNAFSGKKILFITLPLANNDSLFFCDLTAFVLRHKDSIQTICIPAIEDGYNTTLALSAVQQYALTGSGLMVTVPLRVRKDSTVQQSALFQWLTCKENNIRFNVNISASCFKFFVDERGSLFGVLGNSQSLNSMIVSRMVKRKLPVPLSN